LDAEGLCKEAILAQLDFDIAKRRKWAQGICGGLWHKLNAPRQDVLICMAFQLGRDGLASFSKMLLALEEGRYGTAAREMLASKWAQQTPDRVRRLARIMESGEYERPFK
jgi:lysozyme